MKQAGIRHDSTFSRGRFVQFVASTAVIVFIFLTYHVLTWQSFVSVIKTSVKFEELFSDFVIYYYPMGEVIFLTGFPVQGFLYSPFIALLLAMFPPLGLSASLVLWGILQVLFILLFIFLFRRLVHTDLKIQLLFVVLVLSSFPLLLNFLGGQVSVFITVALLGMLVFIEHFPSTGAGLFAFAVSFKFYPVMFIAPFAIYRNIRFLIYSIAAIAVFLFIVPGLLLGAGDTLSFYGSLLTSFQESDWVVTNPHSQYFPHVVLRLVNAIGLDVQASLPLLHWIAFGIAALNMGLVFLVQRARLGYSNLWSFQILFLTIPFVLKTSWPHDFVFLSFTQALLAWKLLTKRKQEPGSRMRSSVMVSLLLLSIIFSNIVFFNILGNFHYYGFCGFLFWADLLLLIILYIEFLPSTLKRVSKP